MSENKYKSTYLSRHGSQNATPTSGDANNQKVSQSTTRTTTVSTKPTSTTTTTTVIKHNPDGSTSNTESSTRTLATDPVASTTTSKYSRSRTTDNSAREEPESTVEVTRAIDSNNYRSGYLARHGSQNATPTSGDANNQKVSQSTTRTTTVSTKPTSTTTTTTVIKHNPDGSTSNTESSTRTLATDPVANTITFSHSRSPDPCQIEDVNPNVLPVNLAVKQSLRAPSDFKSDLANKSATTCSLETQNRVNVHEYVKSDDTAVISGAPGVVKAPIDSQSRASPSPNFTAIVNRSVRVRQASNFLLPITERNLGSIANMTTSTYFEGDASRAFSRGSTIFPDSTPRYMNVGIMCSPQFMDAYAIMDVAGRCNLRRTLRNDIRNHFKDIYDVDVAETIVSFELNDDKYLKGSFNLPANIEDGLYRKITERALTPVKSSSPLLFP